MDDAQLHDVLQKLLERITGLEQQAAQGQKINAAVAQFLAGLEPKLFGTLHHQNATLKQTVNLIARNQPKSGPIRCVFLVHNISTWDALIGVYKAMASAPDFDPIVISLPHSYDHKTFSGEDVTHDALQKAEIPHLRFGMQNSYEGLDILKALAPDIIFRQSQWDDDVLPAYATPELNFARLCYITYGPVMVEIAGGNGLTFDQPYHRFCWRFFCLSEENLKLAKTTSILQGRNTALTGYPKYDQLLAAGAARQYWPIDTGKRNFRVLWTAHHGVKPDWLGFGMFPRIYREMLEWTRAHPDIEVVLKPHPALFESCAYGLMTQAEVDAFKNEWQALPNAALVDGGDYGPLFAASDMMVSDGVGFFSEYQLFDKPLVYLDSRQHDKFNSEGMLALKGMYHATSAPEAIAYVEHFKKGGEDNLKEARQTYIREIMPFPGQSVSRVLDSIRAGLTEEGRIVTAK